MLLDKEGSILHYIHSCVDSFHSVGSYADKDIHRKTKLALIITNSRPHIKKKIIIKKKKNKKKINNNNKK